MHEIHLPTCDQYTACLQTGSGIPVYSGTTLQRGYGIGGFFRGLANGVIPLLPKIGKTLAKVAMDVASDKMTGVPLSKAIKKRGLQAGKRLLMGSTKKTYKKQPTKKRRRSRSVDVFDTV